MRLVRFTPIAESCLCDIALLPNHTFNYCPMEDARNIVTHYISNVDRLVRDRSSSTATEGLVALLKDQATVDLKKVNLFVNSFMMMVAHVRTDSLATYSIRCMSAVCVS